MSSHQHLQGREREQDTQTAPPHPLGLPAALFWPLSAAASVSQATAAALDLMVTTLTGKDNASPLPPEWATPNTVRLELPSMQLRDFSGETAAHTTEPVTLVCAPFAFHRATVADFAPGYTIDYVADRDFGDSWLLAHLPDGTPFRFMPKFEWRPDETYVLDRASGYTFSIGPAAP